MLNGKKKQLALSSAILLAPMVFGLAVWNRLPQTMVTHWGIDGTPNGWSSRGFVVFVLPLIMLAIHWIALLFSAKDLRNRGQDPKVLQLVLWITPAVSVFAFDSKLLCHMVIAGCLKIFVIDDLFCPGRYCSGLGSYFKRLY